jgi:hypothetical protein
MRIPGTASQQRRDVVYDASGTITTGGTAQLVLPVRRSCSYLVLQNNSSGALFFGFGSGRATATITSGAVTSCSVTNAGFGFSRPPILQFMGGFGIAPGVGWTVPTWPSPPSTAKAHCVMTGSAPNQTIASITVDSGGAGYVAAPYVWLFNDDLDPNGAFVPSSGVGVQLLSNGSSMTWEDTVVTTDQVSVWGATTAQAFTCLWMD